MRVSFFFRVLDDIEKRRRCLVVRVKRWSRDRRGNPRRRRRRLEENTVFREDATSLNRGVSKRNGVCGNFVPLLRSDVIGLVDIQPLPGSILNEIIEKRIVREDSVVSCEKDRRVISERFRG